MTHVKDTDSQLAITKFNMNTILTIGPANVLARISMHSTSGAYELTSHLNGGDYTSATSEVTMKLVHKTHFLDKA